MKPTHRDQMVRTSWVISTDLLDRLRLTAARQRISMAQVVRIALESSVRGSGGEPVGGFLDADDAEHDR